MTKRTHTTVTGHRIEYEATPKTIAFLRRIEEAVHDPKISDQELTGLAFSNANPFLDHTMLPGRAMVTKEVLANPAYHEMMDLLFRKQLAEDKTDVRKIEARYSMTVAEAAAELGVTKSAIVQAIAARRIASWLKGGQHYLDPRAVRTLEVGTRAPTGKRRE